MSEHTRVIVALALVLAGPALAYLPWYVPLLDAAGSPPFCLRLVSPEGRTVWSAGYRCEEAFGE